MRPKWIRVIWKQDYLHHTYYHHSWKKEDRKISESTHNEEMNQTTANELNRGFVHCWQDDGSWQSQIGKIIIADVEDTWRKSKIAALVNSRKYCEAWMEKRWRSNSQNWYMEFNWKAGNKGISCAMNFMTLLSKNKLEYQGCCIVEDFVSHWINISWVDLWNLCCILRDQVILGRTNICRDDTIRCTSNPLVKIWSEDR